MSALTVLTPEQIDAIHAASLEILQRVGVELPHEETLSRFAGRGAEVDFETQRVRIPPELVEACVTSAGKSFTIYGRDESQAAAFGQGTRNYNSIAGEALWLDEDSMKRRYARLSDVKTACIVGDALPRLNVVGAMVDPHDAPNAVQDVLVLREMLTHTTKPVVFWFNTRASARYVSETLIALRGSEEAVAARPPTYNFLEPISPLRFAFNGVDLLYETARFPLPVSVGPMAQAGVSAPVTLAGTVAQENAEVLAGICVTQMVREGTPICYGGIPHIFDMRTTQMVFAGPEQALMAVACTQMGKRYGLPVYINVGLTDAKLPDAQAGLEAGVTLALGALAGADIFGHLGICGVDQATSLSMLVMQHEAIGYVERLMQGFEVTPETLAVEVIEGVVGRGESFLAEDHTVRHFRREHWFPELLDRRFFDAWAEAGKDDMAARCRAKLDGILRTHEPEPPSPELCAELDRIAEAALKDAAGR
jgi:trimethylamine--corrinoid protein Co-methyltransferase